LENPAPPRNLKPTFADRLTAMCLASLPLLIGTRPWRLSKWRLTARLVDDIELAVKVVVVLLR
jgi:hypothetical protein